jgi:hypothetical protein
MENSMVGRRAISAVATAVATMAVLATPVLADSEYAGIENPIDWRLVVIFVLIGLSLFVGALTLANRGR